jgi:hypothetical protein
VSPRQRGLVIILLVLVFSMAVLTVSILTGAQRQACHDSWYFRYRYCAGVDPQPTASSYGDPKVSESQYRPGSDNNGRNLYFGDEHVGVLFDPEDTLKIVRSLNSHGEVEAIGELLRSGLIADASERSTRAPDRRLYFVAEEAVDRLDELSR